MSTSTAEPQVVKVAEIMHQGVVFKFQLILIPGGQNPPLPPAGQTIDPLKIVKVVTSGDDGNKGENMLTDNHNTSWTCKGTSCTATFDLGGIQQIGEISVRFPKSTERNASFEISLSNDGQNWLVKLTGEQQDQGGVVLAINPFIDAKYVRFVGQKDLNSIEFVKISGKKMTEPVEPKPEPEVKPIVKPEPAETVKQTSTTLKKTTISNNKKHKKHKN